MTLDVLSIAECKSGRSLGQLELTLRLADHGHQLFSRQGSAEGISVQDHAHRIRRTRTSRDAIADKRYRSGCVRRLFCQPLGKPSSDFALSVRAHAAEAAGRRRMD
jgi:hypothetical protein